MKNKMKIRKLAAVALVTPLLVAGTAGVADAKVDTGWGCGGACRHAGR